MERRQCLALLWVSTAPTSKVFTMPQLSSAQCPSPAGIAPLPSLPHTTAAHLQTLITAFHSIMQQIFIELLGCARHGPSSWTQRQSFKANSSTLMPPPPGSLPGPSSECPHNFLYPSLLFPGRNRHSLGTGMVQSSTAPSKGAREEADEGRQEIPRRLGGRCPWALFLPQAGLTIAPLGSLGPSPSVVCPGPEGL